MDKGKGLDYSQVDREPHTAPECPACHNDGVELGTLGRLQWYRCRACGFEFHGQVTPAEKPAPTESEAYYLNMIEQLQKQLDQVSDELDKLTSNKKNLALSLEDIRSEYVLNYPPEPVPEL